MSMPIDAERWAALRALREAKVPVTHALLAQAAGFGLTAQECAKAVQDFQHGKDHAWLRPTQVMAMAELLDGEPPTQNCIAAVADINMGTVTVRGLKERWARPKIDHWRRRYREKLEISAGTSRVARLASVAAAPGASSKAEQPIGQLPVAEVAAADEGSSRAAGPAAETPEIGRAARVSAMLVKHADQLLTQVERQGGVLTKPQLDAMLAMVRLAEKFEPIAAKEAAENQKKSDAEIAELYEQIEKRIEKRARYHARRMVAARDQSAAAGAGGQQLDASGQ